LGDVARDVEVGSWSGLSPTYAPAVIAIDKFSAIHVAYHQHSLWTIEVVAAASAPSITVDAGALHVAYLVQIDSNGTFELHYARRAPPDGIDQDCDGHGG
jgi:hypothetical protein